MFDYLEGLSVTETGKLQKTIAALFRQTCILQEKYDPVTLAPSDNEQYGICVKHRPFLEAYLQVLGCELVHDATEHIFRLAGEGVLARQIPKSAAILILLVKMIYRDKIMGDGLSATATNLAEIRDHPGKYRLRTSGGFARRGDCGSKRSPCAQLYQAYAAGL